MDLHQTSCIIFIFSLLLLQTSQLPIDNRLMLSNNKEPIKGLFHTSINQHEIMKSSASNYYTSDDEDDYSDYGTGTLPPSPDTFESERIIKRPSDVKKLPLIEINKNASEVNIQNDKNNRNFNGTQLSLLPRESNENKFPKLLFSSPSATLTSSNGPSGPLFKAVICHDCENSGGANVGHYSVSFSAIKSWNVGNKEKSNFTESPSSGTEKLLIDSIGVEQTSKKYIEGDLKLPAVQNQGSGSEITVNASGSEQTSSPASLNNKNEWNYSLLTVKNENINVNSHHPTMTTTKTTTTSPLRSFNHQQTSSNDLKKKPIFNDLLKVPYDVLNAPLSEPASAIEPVTNTQIQFNHQQNINDTISNYHHYQQFVQKNVPNQEEVSTTPPSLGHYQSTAMPEQNYEVDEAVSLMTNGRAHGIQSTTPKLQTSSEEHKNFQPTIHAQVNVDGKDSKFGVVFQSRDFRKYKVEEKTADGFIVGEYGYLSNTDGSPLFGVRYTADSNINPQLIYDALLKFIKL